MKNGKPRKTDPAGTSREEPAVIEFLRDLDHPLRADVEKVRGFLLGADPSIAEGIKWNAPSFRTTDYFATFHLRSRDRIQLVFHTGAKKKATADTGVDIPDPAGLLKWLAKDRCMVTLGAGSAIDQNRAAFEDLVRAWILWV